MQKINLPGRNLEEMLGLLLEKSAQQPMTVNAILDVLSGKARYLMALILSLPFCLPIQIPGFSTPFGVLIMFIGIEIILQRKLWMPKFILEKDIQPGIVEKLVKSGLWINSKIKPWIHQRLTPICYNTISNMFAGLMIAFLGLMLALPLPLPFSNLVSAWPIFLICFGFIEEDGLIVLIGYALACLSITFFSVLFFFFKSILF